MDDDEFDEDEYEVPLEPSRPWSWPWFFESLLNAAGSTLRIVATFLEEGVAVQFNRMHNLKTDREDQRALATDVLADLGQLPTKE